MLKLIGKLFFLVAIPVLVSAQSKGQGYFFVAPGGISGSGRTVSSLHFGGGGEGLLYKGLGVGGEIGYLGLARSLGDGFGVFSANGSYHFRTRSDRKLAPFVTAGYSLAFRSGTANMFNFGGGVHYWFCEKVGLRLEFRDHVWSREAHFWGLRIGVAFR